MTDEALSDGAAHGDRVAPVTGNACPVEGFCTAS
jgi:hypothetical protein